MTESLKALVEKGTITQAQSDKILKKLEDAQKERQALKSKGPISELVKDGTITQDQADALGKVIFNQKGFRGGHKGFRGGQF